MANRTKLCTQLTDYDIYLLKQGKHYRLFEKFGSREMVLEGETGIYFAVWAPAAKYVSVIGDFNEWDGEDHQLYVRWDGSGIWEGFIPGLAKGTLYKYSIVSTNRNQILEKADPYGYTAEHPPQTATKIWSLDYTWGDQEWMTGRKAKNSLQAPYSIYEVHLGSWRRDEEGKSLSYRAIAQPLADYVNELGFTHVEFMPVMHFPYEPSWGYQITGFFAASSRYGNPEDLMYLIDTLHQAGIGVIMDWVPSHFPTDGPGLGYFDGTHAYEHSDPRKGFHPDWQSLIFNYGRPEVRAFLISNAIFWLEKYHVDGLRVDAVASMLYLDYSRKEGEWEPNEFGGNGNLQAISFIKELNTEVYRAFPDVQTIAEESTAYPGVSHPVDKNGLGFGMKWMMGWMHDTLKYFSMDPLFRKNHQGQITFSMIYAFHENFVLPLSHDEVVHGKASLIYKMPGTEDQKFAQLRLLYTYMFTHPCAKLLFMGGEFAQTKEWNFKSQLSWSLLEFPYHKGVQLLVKDLNHLFRSYPALYSQNYSLDGFEWVDISDYHHSIIVYRRKCLTEDPDVLVLCNFTPIERTDYLINLPFKTDLELIFNSASTHYHGDSTLVADKLVPKRITLHEKYYYQFKITLPAFGGIIFKIMHKPPIINLKTTHTKKRKKTE